MSNEFDLGLNIASIETELPDPVITLTGSDNLTASETAEMPLLALTAYGRSWQDERIVNVANVGIKGYGIKAVEGNYTDANGQEWVCDELIVNADGTGKIINNTIEIVLNGTEIWTINGGYFYHNKEYFKDSITTGFKSTVGVVPYTTIDSGGYGLAYAYGFRLRFKNMNPENNTLDEFKSYLANNNITIFGIAKSSTETELTTEQLTTLQPVIDKYGAFTAYFMSTQDGTPTPENPVEIVSTADLHRVSVPIESIGDSGSLTVTTCGKNLLNIDSEYYHANKGYVLKFIPITLAVGKAYTFSFTPNKSTANAAQITLRNAKGAVVIDSGALSFIANKQIAFTFVVDKDVVDLSFYVNTSDITLLNIQLESNNTVTNYEPYKSTTATVTNVLPLRGIPVDSGGNYTDSSGQEWICDTLEHIYGEPAQITKRVEMAHFKSVMETHECDAVMVVKNTADHFVYFGRYGRYFKNSTLRYYLYECLWEERYNVDTGELIYSIEGDGKNRVAEFAHRIYGKWTVENTDEPVSFAEPLWELDNGKSIPAEYICETGTFVNGAEVLYPCELEILQLTTKETEALNTLSGFTGSTKIYNNNTAEMTVKLLREDFEMQYIHWIKESQSFVCEKTGKYKIICVGGGSSGGVGAPETAETLQAAGTTTSFGNIISAEGGGKTKATLTALNFSEVVVGGQSGYDGINYGSTSHVMACDSSVHFTSAGGNSSVMWGTGHGYGAGGGARAYSSDLVAAGGRCGKVESTIVDLEENQIIACTIGGGGVLKLSDANVLDYLKTYVDKETSSASGMGEKVSACVSDGADGVIIIQYLGV